MKLYKKSFSVILAVLMLVSVFVVAPISANAEVTKSGTVGDCQYEFDSTTGHLRIFGGTTIEKDDNGNGKMPWATDGPASFNSLSVKSVTIESGIKTIGNGAFYWCKNLTSVTMPDYLETIGKSAFSYCTGLKTIRLPFDLKTIDMAAFSNCTALESISISTHIELIGNEAFKGCTKLAEVTINDGAKAEIGNYAFCDTALTDVFIPAGTKKIGMCAFGYDKGYSPIAAFTIYTTEGSVGETYAKNEDHITVEYIKPITNVDFTDIVEPVVGESPSYTYNTTTKGFTVENAKPVWTNETDFETVSASGKFKAMKEYSVAFTLKADKGYRFAVDDKRKTTVKATINGQEAIITADSKTPEDKITVYLYFPKLYDPDNPVIINNVKLSPAKTPAAGEIPNKGIFLYGEGYSVESMFWYNATDGKQMSASGIFEPLKEYRAYVVLKTDNYYAFAVSGDKSQVSCLIDGNSADVYKVDNDPSKRIRVVSQKYKTGELEIPTVNFTGVNEPEVNEEADFTFKASEGFTVENNEINWWNDTDKKDMVKGDKFEKGKTYIAFFNLTAKDGYNFTDDNGFTTVTATVNHKDAAVQQLPGQNPEKQLRVYVKYSAIQEKTHISNVSVTGLDEPVIGEKPDYTVSVSPNVTVSEINWYKDGSLMKDGAVFEYGNKYIAFIHIKPNAGYTFKGDEREVTINGKKVHISYNLYEDYINADTSFETEADPNATCETYETSEPYDTDPVGTTAPDTQKSTEPEEVTEPDTIETTEPEEVTEPDTIETTEPEQTEPDTIETAEPEYTEPAATDPEDTQPDTDAPVEPQPSEIKILYLPSDEQALNSYQYLIYFKEKEGSEEFRLMSIAGDTMNGKTVHEVSLPAGLEFEKVTIQVIDFETLISEVEINPHSVVNGAVFNSEGFPITIEPETNEPAEPEYTEPAATDPVFTEPDTTVPAIVEPTTVPSAVKPKSETTVKPDNKKTDTKKTAKAKTKTSKKKNTVSVKAKAKTVKLKKLKKKNQTVKALTVKKAKGKVTYKLIKKGTNKKIYKYLKISKKGVITFKKWKKAKKGSYKVKVQITAKGNKSYKPKSITKVFKIKVK